MIKIKDISIVVQGAVGHRGENFKKNASAIRNLFPVSEIILSTWEGSYIEDTKELFNHVVFSEDPGPSYIEPVTKSVNNLNRQAVSTLSGLEIATKKYAIKVRTDFSIESHSFIEEYLHLVKQKNDSLFTMPVLTLYNGSRNPFESGMLLCPSDFFQFGLTKDLISYWDFEFPNKELITLGIWEKLISPRRGPRFIRYNAEQLLFIEFLKKHNEPICFRRYFDYSFDCIVRAHELLNNNFVFVNHEEHGIKGPSSLLGNPAQYRGCYTADTLLKIDNCSLAEKKKYYFISKVNNWVYYFSIVGLKSYIACLLRLLKQTGLLR